MTPTRSTSAPPDRPAPAVGAAYPGFLGRGWGFPPTFNRLNGSVVMADGREDINQAIWIILSTSLGERLMLPTFGCDLMSKVFTTLTTTSANEIATMVTNAIIEWEPRVSVETVQVTDALLEGWLDISIDYVVRQTNTRSNLVFPYCRIEATLPPAPT